MWRNDSSPSRVRVAASLASLLSLLASLVLPLVAAGQSETTKPSLYRLELPPVALRGVGFPWKIHGPLKDVTDDRISYRLLDGQNGQVLRQGDIEPVRSTRSSMTYEPPLARLGRGGRQSVILEINGRTIGRGALDLLPPWVSLTPPLLVISCAIFSRHVMVAVSLGVALGSLLVSGGHPFDALLRVVDHYIVEVVAQERHVAVLVFTLLLGGMVGLVLFSGGGRSLGELLTRRARSRRRAQFATWGLGFFVFFDDYASSMLVGTSMRPLCDRLRISREKLAFLVDATSAPIASLALVSSWTGIEVNFIAEEFRKLGIRTDPYLIFLQTLPYRFYPLLMIVFTLLIVLTRRDFGPMWKAEQRAVSEGKLLADGAMPISDFLEESISPPTRPRQWLNALVPIVVLGLSAPLAMYFTGSSNLRQARARVEEQHAQALRLLDRAEKQGEADAALQALQQLQEAKTRLFDLEIEPRRVFSHADSVRSLLWASLLGSLVAFFMVLGRRILPLEEAMEAWLQGMRSVVPACIILVLAWALGGVCDDLLTAHYIIQSLGDEIAPSLLPALIFWVSAVVSFATGAAWGTMAILFPLVVPLAHQVGGGQLEIMLSSIASILAGSVWGDHCSPVSDTTILSSMASSCDHRDHVRTQIPYALLVGVVSVFMGDLATGLALYPPWVGLLMGTVFLTAFLFWRGRLAQKAAHG